MTNTTRSRTPVALYRCALFAVGLSSLCLWLGSLAGRAEAAVCSPDTIAAVMAPATEASRPVEIDCDLSLPQGAVVTMPIGFSGHRASGVTLDCNGAVLDGTRARERTVIIRSLEKAGGQWDVPRDIRVRNCTIRGDLRIQGLGRNGQADKVRLSSLQPGHTERAQAAAPSGIELSNIDFVARDAVPLYIAPGVTGVTVENSRFTGRTVSTVIYLDAESAHNRIVGNRFDATTAWREVIAVDGSADNRIEGNTFQNPSKGGVYIYRNCGEGGTIRHQPPRGNVVRDNVFRYRAPLVRPAIWIGSRQGLSLFNVYCLAQPRLMLDGLHHDDEADDNLVAGNRFEGGPMVPVVDQGHGNHVSDNR